VLAAGDARAVADPEARRWAWWLTAATITWNSLEAVIAIVGGVFAGSIALVGFGLDSVVEVASAAVIVWRLSQRTADHVALERAERRAVRLIALSFFGIAAFVTVDAAFTLLGLRDEPQRSPVGLGITALSLVVMPTLAWAKRRVAARLNSVALKADAAETQLCTYLSDGCPTRARSQRSRGLVVDGPDRRTRGRRTCSPRRPSGLDVR
jgi:divalent metal cation (Fe/Co/Zn/Cd) transporter